MFSGIKSKIILLLSVAICLMAVTGVTNIYVELSKRGETKVASACMKVALGAKEGMMLEESYFKEADALLLQRITDNRQEMDRLLQSAANSSKNRQIRKLIDQVVVKGDSRRVLFQEITANDGKIRELMTQYDKILQTINEKCMGIVGKINEEESFLSMEGEPLSLNLSTMRDQLTFLQSMIDKKMIILQRLFVQHGLDQFREDKKAVDEKIRAELPGMNNLIKLINNTLFTENWRALGALIETINSTEGEIAMRLKKNEEQNGLLKQNSAQIQTHIQDTSKKMPGHCST